MADSEMPTHRNEEAAEGDEQVNWAWGNKSVDPWRDL